MQTKSLKFTIALTAILVITINGFAQKIIKQCLDSIVTPEYSKTIFSYDSRGNSISDVTYHYWGCDNGWKEENKIEHVHDNNGSITTTYYDFWDDETNNWGRSSKAEFTYDNKGNLTLSIVYIWDDNSWKEFDKYKYTHDNKGNRTLSILYSWDDVINSWEEYYKYKYKYTYDNKGYKTINVRYFRDNNAWKKAEKKECTYDKNGNRTLYINYNLDFETNVWYWTDKIESTYNLSYSIKDLIIPHSVSIDYTSTNMLTEERRQYYGQNTIITYYWSEKTIDITEDNNGKK